MTCGKCKDLLEGKLNAKDERERIIDKISNFGVASVFSIAGVIAGGKIALYGIQNKNEKSFCVGTILGTILICGGIAGTFYCFDKIKKGWDKLKHFYY